jgi:ring-1,2-phenylacetyl-CoA epoxidase subunit PaaC
MKPEVRTALASRLLAAADDELILGHRNSEWCGHAPILEEDIAFANISLDEIGHAVLWYGLLAELLGEPRETYPDQLVYQRPASEFRNIQLVELPRGDWAFTILRQYLFDAAEAQFLEAYLENEYQPIAEVAARVRKEEIYHLRHTSSWVRRLGLGTVESNRRMQAALGELWAYSLQLFVTMPGDDLLIEEGIYPDPRKVGSEWQEAVRPFLEAAGLTIPMGEVAIVPTRNVHSEHLVPLISDLQSVRQSNADAVW